MMYRSVWTGEVWLPAFFDPFCKNIIEPIINVSKLEVPFGKAPGAFTNNHYIAVIFGEPYDHRENRIGNEIALRAVIYPNPIFPLQRNRVKSIDFSIHAE
jgi:hypothetical protein